MRDRPEERGFTLIELMVVVLIIAILLAIAIPTFLGARERASDRAAQTNLRNAHTAAFVYYVGKSQQFTEDTGLMQDVDPSLSYTNDASSLVAGPQIYVEVPPAGTSRPLDTIYLGSRSGTGRCFWIRSIGDENHPRFATDDCTPEVAAPDLGLSFTDRW
jgi:type IV pilus assembly protein PilA